MEFCCLACGVPTPGKLLQVHSRLQLYVLLVEFSCVTVTKSLMEAVVADPTLVLSTIATRFGMC